MESVSFSTASATFHSQQLAIIWPTRAILTSISVNNCMWWC